MPSLGTEWAAAALVILPKRADADKPNRVCIFKRTDGRPIASSPRMKIGMVLPDSQDMIRENHNLKRHRGGSDSSLGGKGLDHDMAIRAFFIVTDNEDGLC